MIIEPLRFAPDLPLPRALGSEEDSLNFEDADGQNLVARACRDGDWCWLWLDGVGSFRFPAVPQDGALKCDVVLDEGASDTEAVDDYYRSVAPMAFQVYGLEALHGTAVRGPSGALVLLAPSRTGKTTLACELLARGHELVADDAVVLEVPTQAASPALRPLPFVARLRDDSAARYSRPIRDRTVVAGAARLGDPVPLAGFVMLDRREDVSRPTLERLASSAALKALLSRCYFHYSNDDSRHRRLIAAYLRVTRDVPVYSLTYPSGYEHLGAVADLLQDFARS